MTPLSHARRVHLIGIGGIGVSALARLLMHRGIEVSGSDRTLSRITEELARLGARVSEGHASRNLASETDVVIYSPAISENNPERVRAMELRIPQMTYPQALGEISRDAHTIAVSGTHGKTTTTAMLADVLRQRVQPTVIVGSLLSGGRSNFVPGDAKRFLVEACEYKRSFLNLEPTILVITNIDVDHLDYYKDLDDIVLAFRTLAQKVPEHGFIVCDLDDEPTRRALTGVSATIVNYGAYYDPNRKLSVMGEHNLKNAAAAQAVADIFGVPYEETASALEGFRGTWRRSEHKGELQNGAPVFDDYGHHPREIRTTLKGFRQRFPEKKIIVAFQPHLYSRTKTLFNDFVESFDGAYRVLVAPIYAAREKDDGSISHHTLAGALRQRGLLAESHGDLESIEHELRRSASGGNIILTLGAGDIYEVGERLLKRE